MKRIRSNLLLGILFLAGTLFISYSIFWAVPLLLVLSYFIYRFNRNKKLFLTITAFLIGFTCYQIAASFLSELTASDESRILLNRLALLLVITSLVIVSRFFKKPFQYNHKPDWNETISFPFIFSGFHSIKISLFLMIAIMINLIVFLPFIYIYLSESTENLFLFAISFALINATLEEFLWRGYLLSQFKESANDYYALIFTSIGFGIQHVSIGFPLIPSLLFSFGGIFFAGVVMKSNSIYPTLFWHFLLNIGMVYSGFILR